MHRGNRSARWKEQPKVGLAPDLTVCECQKGGLGPPVFLTRSPSSQSSFAPLSLTSLAHLTRSASMYWRNSAGEVADRFRPSATGPIDRGLQGPCKNNCAR